MRAALLQMTGSDRPEDNLATILAALDEAARQGAQVVLTPEVCNCLSTSRSHQEDVLRAEDQDIVLAGVRAKARDLGLWVLLGSIAVKTGDANGRFANRSILISDNGEIVARYDKIHMFDVQLTETETFRESEGYRPGDRAVLADTPFGKIGMTVCYDIRFPHLYRDLAQAGARIITVPSAFSPVTGAAHWETLLRARAIETGCFVLAPAQTGAHPISRGKPRSTHGHSLAIAPWGEVLADAGTAPGLTLVDLDLEEVDRARRRVPSLAHGRHYVRIP